MHYIWTFYHQALKKTPPSIKNIIGKKKESGLRGLGFEDKDLIEFKQNYNE